MGISRRSFVANALRVATLPALAEMPVCPAMGASGTLRLAAPDRGAMSSALALGEMPVAGVGRQFYIHMGATPPMPAGVENCGSPTEPNLELLQTLGVNLFATVTTSSAIADLLTQVAPVLRLDIYTGYPGALDRARTGLLELANRTGREATAKAYIRTVESQLDELGEEFKGKRRRPVYLVALDASGRNMTVYGRNSIMYDVMERIGLKNAWSGKTNGFGFANTGIEQMADEPDADILYMDYGIPTTAALKALAASPFWSNLPAVRAGRVFRLPLIDPFNSYPVALPFAHALRSVARSGQYADI